MGNITVRNVPDHVHKLLKRKAGASRRSLNQEILKALELWASAEDERELLDEVRALRQRVTMLVDDDLLASYRKEGRP